MNPLALSSAGQMDALLERSRTESRERTPNETALKKACNDFEAVLTAKILKTGMKTAEELGGRDDEDNDKGSESFREMAYEQMAEFIGRQGTLGLGDMLFNKLKTRLKDTGDSQ